MTIRASWVGGVGLGAALMFLLDPDRGRRRRAMVRDGIVSRAGGSKTFLGKSGRDVANRARGLAARTRRLVGADGPVADDVLAERVRSKLGRYVSHPGAIEVDVADGDVILRGPVLAAEAGSLLSAVRSVRGVRLVSDHLEVHEDASDEPALQGGARRRRGETSEFRQEHWSPAARVAAGTAGGALIALGIRRHDRLGLAAGAVGTGLLARSVANRSARRIAGFGRGTRAYEIPISGGDASTNGPDVFEEPAAFENPEQEDWAV